MSETRSAITGAVPMIYSIACFFTSASFFGGTTTVSTATPGKLFKRMHQRRPFLLFGSIIAAAIFLTGCRQGQLATPVPPRPSMMASPSPIAPPDQSVFTNFPRTVHFRWSNGPENARYAIEIDCRDCCVSGRWCTAAGLIVIFFEHLIR